MVDKKPDVQLSGFAPDASIQQESTIPDISVSKESPNIIEQKIPIQDVEVSKETESKETESDKDNFLDEAIVGLRKTLKRPKKKKSGIIPQVRDELTVEIEHVMEEGLKDAFTELTPVQAQEFKIKGEQTAQQIRQLLKGTKIKVKQIVKLLFDWLKLLPGVNKFFLEQEAKIKADKIVALKNYFSSGKK